MLLKKFVPLSVVVALVVLVCFSLAFPQSSVDPKEMMSLIDNKLTLESDLYSGLSIVSRNPNPDGGSEPLVESTMGEFYRKDSENKFLFIFTAPRIDAGTGYLFIDDNLWFYDKNSREFSRRTASDSIGGSNSRTRDLRASTLSKDFNWKYVGENSVRGVECYEFYGEAAVQDVAYPITRIWVRKDALLPFVRREYSLARGTGQDRENRLIQTLYYINYRRKKADKEGEIDKYIATKILVQNHQDNSSTVIDFENVSFENQPGNIFTKAYLENRSN